LPEDNKAGNVIIYTGDGKGKTSAAIGTAIRASGHGNKVLIVFFLKGTGYKHGEVIALEKLPGISIKSFGQDGWVKKGRANEGDIEQAHLALDCSSKAILGSDFDFVIMDEVLAALDCGLIEFGELESVIKNRPAEVSLVLTGRNADKRLYDVADIITEMKPVKYTYGTKNIARKGLDY
jgi:cob(I)alamin adenosyltransferase